MQISNPVGNSSQFTAENKTGAPVNPGTALMLHASGVGFVLWTGARPFIGLAKAYIENAVSGPILTCGPLKLADWTPVTGAATLSAGTHYASYATPGQLTLVAPTVVGEVVQQVGMAVAPDTLEIQFGPEVLL